MDQQANYLQKNPSYSNFLQEGFFLIWVLVFVINPISEAVLSLPGRMKNYRLAALQRSKILILSKSKLRLAMN